MVNTHSRQNVGPLILWQGWGFLSWEARGAARKQMPFWVAYNYGNGIWFFCWVLIGWSSVSVTASLFVICDNTAKLYLVRKEKRMIFMASTTWLIFRDILDHTMNARSIRMFNHFITSKSYFLSTLKPHPFPRNYFSKLLTLLI